MQEQEVVQGPDTERDVVQSPIIFFVPGSAVE